jgi:hypothetical protein
MIDSTDRSKIDRLRLQMDHQVRTATSGANVSRLRSGENVPANDGERGERRADGTYTDPTNEVISTGRIMRRQTLVRTASGRRMTSQARAEELKARFGNGDGGRNGANSGSGVVGGGGGRGGVDSGGCGQAYSTGGDADVDRLRALAQSTPSPGEGSGYGSGYGSGFGSNGLTDGTSTLIHCACAVCSSVLIKHASVALHR